MRDTFPALDESIYLNTAYVGLPSNSLMDFRAAFDRQYLREGDQFKIKGYQRLESQREEVAAFLGSDAAHTFITPNFSIGFRFLLDVLPTNTRTLILQDEYHSLENAWNERGLIAKRIFLSATVEATIEAELATGNYDVFTFSVVQYTSGVLLDLEVLARIKKRFPKVLFIADGTQFLGAEAFNFKQSPLDVIAASGYKWLLAGFSNGLTCVNQTFLDFCGITKEKLEAIVYAGHFDFLGAASLAFATHQLNHLDFSTLLEEKNKITNYLRQGLAKRNLLDPIVNARKKHASIFNISGDEPLYEQLQNKGVRCSQRAEGIRLSVHFYNNENDIDRFFEVFDSRI